MARARAPEALTDLEQIRGGPELGTLVLVTTKRAFGELQTGDLEKP